MYKRKNSADTVFISGIYFCCKDKKGIMESCTFHYPLMYIKKLREPFLPTLTEAETP